MREVRTRIAPSPTGMMHLGTARTAIYCWAAARHHGGKFILRVEDTDRERSTDAATQVILDAMRWLELDFDEGPIFQMDRLPHYRQVVEEMLADGRAYRCWASPEELAELRESQRRAGLKPRYDGRWRPENSRGRTPPSGVEPVIRFRNPDEGTVSWEDAVYGPISVANRELDDLVIMRGGVPTYNFAVVVDDIDMAISHVIRGADHINNTPRQINIYRALGAELPVFAHLPLILGPDGQKLSKRHGSVAVTQYEEEGYLPETVFNYLARLGWGHGNMEKFSRDELAAVFDLRDCSKASARLDFKKLRWLNGQYLKEADDRRLAGLVAPRLRRLGADPERGPDLSQACALLKSRSATLEELAAAALFLYQPGRPGTEAVAAALADGGREALADFRERLTRGDDFSAAGVYAAIQATMAGLGVTMRPLANALRVLVCRAERTPQIDQTLALLGRDTVLRRLDEALGDRPPA